ncbi:GtrA family protein [Microvirga sesbaniae]|uniref:GtrA family protein n=1 Tax=Microvirga sesbaniae TaxID=681392 RepID=UPI0021CA0EB3|nr:GtrA family protein [Microvirga sp. HBU67692]
MLESRFIRFLFTSGLAAGVNIGSRWLLGFVMPYELAICLAYLFGMTTAFVLAKLFVFKASGAAVHKEYVRFAIVNAAAFLQVWLVSVGLARFIFPAVGLVSHGETIAHIIGVLSPALTSYFAHKNYSFRTEST